MRSFEDSQSRRTAFLVAAAMVCAGRLAQAQTPLGTEFTYQGRLKVAGSPAGGIHDLRFRLYDAVSGGAQVGATICANDVSMTDGLFTVSLDFGDQFAGEERFLELDVRADTGLYCTNPAGFTLLGPRQALTTAPNASFAMNADLLDGLDSSAFLQSIPVPLTLSGANSTHIIHGENAGTFFDASGVYGQSTAPVGFTNGVLGESQSTSGTGVAGFAFAGSGYTHGGYFRSDSTSGSGVVGFATPNSGHTYGGYFLSSSTDGIGVLGWANAGSGSTYGVYGDAFSPSGSGVYGVGGGYGGRFESGGTFGVYGRSSSTDGLGVFGFASATSGATAGVLGEAFSPNGWAVYAAGNFGAGGTKSFRIDHPFDPENKWLLHYAAESNEVINFYRGTVVLDGAGEAVVHLPAYFATVNRTPSYQLTAVGAPMPMLHVAEEIDEAALTVGAGAAPGQAAPVCSFRIAGGTLGGKVSWRVEAVRNDRWVQQRGAPVEAEKQGLERGKYQHPELYGQPPENRMNYHQDRAAPALAGKRDSNALAKD